MAKRTLKTVITAILLLLTISALAIGTAAVFYTPKTPTPTIDVSGGTTTYSSATAIRYRTSMQPLFGTGNNLEYFNQIDVLVDNIYLAMSRAGLSEEKVCNILDEVEAMGLNSSSESPILAFLTTAIRSTQNADDSGTAEEIVTREQLTQAFSDSLTFLNKVGITTDETGRVLYQLALLYADEQRLQLLQQLGSNNFTMLTVGTYAVYSAAEQSSSKSSITTARSLGQSLNALGLSYRLTLDAIGAEGIDDLCGLNYVLDVTNPAIDADYAANYNTMLTDLYGAAGNTVTLTANILTRLKAAQFEELYLYGARLARNDQTEAKLHLNWAMMSFASAAKAAFASTVAEVDAFDSEDKMTLYFAEKYSRLQCLLDETENLSPRPTYDDYYQDTLPKMQRYTQLVGDLSSAAAQINDYDALKAYSVSHPAEYETLTAMASELNSTDFDLNEITTELISGLTKAAMVRIFVGLAAE